MQLTLKTPPTEEPVSVEEVKSYLKLPYENNDEAYLRQLISTARIYVEKATGRALLKQKWGLSIKPPFPTTSPLVKREEERLKIILPYPPLIEVESVKSKDTDIYFKIEENKILLHSFLWNKEISISYWAGYGSTDATLPADLKMAVLITARCLYDYQHPDVPLLNPFKVYRVL